MSATTTYDLLDEPWVLALDLTGEVREHSIREALHDAGRLRRIVGELPSQEVAVLRLLLAILHRALAVDGNDEEAREEWGIWWATGSLPRDLVDPYLDRYADRFDLLHPQHPFMQVPDLRTASGKTSGTAKLIAEVPAGHRFFTTRTGEAARSLAYAEAARWLVHVQAFDASGIKTGAIGDPRVRGGKGYPLGIGWTGNLGVVILEGQTLAQTLLLNLVLHPGSAPEDQPPWEGPPLGAAPTGSEAPWGPAQAMTWQIRRVRLIHDGRRVQDAVISNGDPVRLRNQHEVETMTGFRRSAPQEAKHKESLVYMARQHQAGRAIWRGLESLIASAPVQQAARTSDDRVAPRTVSWVASLRNHGQLDEHFPLRLRTVGVVFGANNSVVDAVLSDELQLHVAVLSDPVVRATAIEAARSAEAAARLLGRFAGNLATAEGRDKDADQARGFEAGLGELDGPYRAWVAELTPENRAMGDHEWRVSVHRHLRRVASRLVQQASPAGVRGRVVEDRNGKPSRVDAVLAHTWFVHQLGKEVPLEQAPEGERDE